MSKENEQINLEAEYELHSQSEEIKQLKQENALLRLENMKLRDTLLVYTDSRNYLTISPEMAKKALEETK